MRWYRLGTLGLLLTGLVLACFGPACAARLDEAEAAWPESGDRIQLNFRDVDIVHVIRLMSELTGKNFLVDGNVRGKVTLVAPEPVSVDEAYEVFLSILEVQGFTVVPQGAIIKVIPSDGVKDSPIPTATGEAGALPANPGDAFVTRLIALSFADVDQVRGLLAPLISAESSLLSYEPTNTLIVTETASNLARLQKIIAALDVKAPAKAFRVIALEHAEATELAAPLQTALEGLSEANDEEDEPDSRAERRRRRRRRNQPEQRNADAPAIIADARTNSLVLIATPADIEIAQDIIADLDIPAPAGRGKIHVYYLSHADAEELAQVLTVHAPDIARIQDVRADAPGQQPGRACNGQHPHGHHDHRRQADQLSRRHGRSGDVHDHRRHYQEA